MKKLEKLKVTIVGGGSTWTPGILKALIHNQAKLPMSELVLYDIDEKRQKIIGDYAVLLFKETLPNIKVSYTTDKQKAYENVDYVMVQMRTGGYPMRELDEKIPPKFGVIGQETCGPGGFAYGIRSLKDMIAFVKDVRAYSEKAWILNYTNPAAIVGYGLKEEFPDDKRILNICDQPINLTNSYAKLIGVDPKNLEPRYFGLNHFGWFTHMYDENGVDLLPDIISKILNEGFLPADAEERDASWLDTYAMVQDMLIDNDEYLPNTYLQYYLYPEYKFTKMNHEFTRANEVMVGREKRVFEECLAAVNRGYISDEKVVANDAHGQMIIDIASAIHNNTNEYYVVMVENDGIIPNLPSDALVEVTCLLGRRGPEPLHVGTISTFYKGLIENQYAYEKLTWEAFKEGSYKKALQALILNRTVTDSKNARKILDALIDANKGYWPELK